MKRSTYGTIVNCPVALYVPRSVFDVLHERGSSTTETGLAFGPGLHQLRRSCFFSARWPSSRLRFAGFHFGPGQDIGLAAQRAGRLGFARLMRHDADATAYLALAIDSRRSPVGA